MMRLLAVFMIIVFLSVCGILSPATATPSPAPPPTNESPTSVSTGIPGLQIQGMVHLKDGTGLAGVELCRNYSAYPGEIVATSAEDGHFISEFAGIPGDEMVGVWPVKTGYTFDPAYVRWRHYYGHEVKTLDFTAVPSEGTAVPPAECR